MTLADIIRLKQELYDELTELCDRYSLYAVDKIEFDQEVTRIQKEYADLHEKYLQIRGDTYEKRNNSSINLH